MMKWLLASAGLIALVGCAAEDDAEEIESQEAAYSFSNNNYWRVVAPDDLSCEFPECGGVYVAKVNGVRTRCADNTIASRCYVSTLNLDALGLPEKQLADVRELALSGQVVLRASKLEFRTLDDSGYQYPVLEAQEAWENIAPGEAAPRGTFYRASDSGLRCATTPCPSLVAGTLNRTGRYLIEGIDTSRLSASDDTIERAWARLSEEGFFFATTDGGVQPKANAIFSKVTAREVEPEPEPEPVEPCFVGGCSSHVCSDRPDVITNCRWQEQYACYRTATCERQASGACGWTQTTELTSCLASKR